MGAPEFTDWDELNAYLREKSEADQQRRPRGKEATVGQLLAEERMQMRPLPDRPCPTAKSVTVQANKLSLVTFATNRYSVPVAHAHEALTLRASAQWVEISNGQEVIARHRRCWGREQDKLAPYHYLPLLARRPRAFEHAAAIGDARPEWPLASAGAALAAPVMPVRIRRLSGEPPRLRSALRGQAPLCRTHRPRSGGCLERRKTREPNIQKCPHLNSFQVNLPKFAVCGQSQH